MSGSYEKINYSLRPAKSIERKMLCEAFRRLSTFGRIEAYRYVGFGSTYFTDFVLFHKSLGIANMISIERHEENRDRFLFNRPFSCIDIKFGESTEILPTLNWDMRTILWLDYDGKLDASVLADIKFFCANAQSGSMLIISVNAQPDKPNDLPINVDGISAYRLQQLIDCVGEDKIPIGFTGEDLNGWGKAKICRRIIENDILQTLSERNGGRNIGCKIIYKQLFNFHYADGVKMLTIGGLLYDEGQEHLFNQSAFQNLSFIKSDSEPYVIEVPNLTYKEIRFIDAQLPATNNDSITTLGIPSGDIKKYAQVYRYFPNFAEAEI